MASIRKRKRAKQDVWIVDYEDVAHVRHRVTCRTRQEAEDVLAEKIQESRQAPLPGADEHVTLADYATRWLQEIAVDVKPRTLGGYEQNLRLHLLPARSVTSSSARFTGASSRKSSPGSGSPGSARTWCG